jgi:hypothetical protein
MRSVRRAAFAEPLEGRVNEGSFEHAETLKFADIPGFTGIMDLTSSIGWHCDSIGVTEDN